MAKKMVALKYVESEGGPFILVPVERKKDWEGAGDDYDRATSFGSGTGVIEVGAGKALILGNADVTAFMPLADGGVFVQRVYGDEDEDVIAAVEKAVAATDWTATGQTFDTGTGKLVLFDAACTYEDSDKGERLPVTLPPGAYAISTRAAKSDDGEVEVGLVRLRKS